MNLRKKDIFFYFIIFALLVALMWEWTSKSALLGVTDSYLNERNKFGNYIEQFSLITGIGALGSTHIHADVKVYIDGKAIDFSGQKYQLATSYIHFEEGVGEVIHIHATGLTAGHMLNSLKIPLDGGCITVEGIKHCQDSKNLLKLYVNGKKADSINDYVFQDLDKILISYGPETPSEVQKQLDSVTDLAINYRGQEMED